MSDQESRNVTSAMAPGGEVVIPTGRIAAWRYRRSLIRRVRARVHASVGLRSASGITTYVIAVSNTIDPTLAEPSANRLVARARKTGLFAVIRDTHDGTFNVLIEGEHDAVLRFVVDFYVSSHLNGSF